MGAESSPGSPQDRPGIVLGFRLVEFRLEHAFDATLAEMEAVLLADPGLFALLEDAMPGIEEVRLLDQQDDGRVLTRRVRYVPHGKIPGFAKRFITREMTSWVEVSRYDRARARFDYEIQPSIPEKWRDRFESAGSYTLTPAAGGAGKVHRVIDGRVVIRAAVVGGLAERFLVAEVKKNFEHEALGLQQHLLRRKDNG